MATKIQIRDLTKSFGKGPPAVDQVSLTVDPGELFFLLGPSGCGKSTLLRMIAGFTEPTSGSVWFNDRDITHVPANQRNTGMVFQSYALWPHMSVSDNTGFGLDVRRVHGDDRARRIASVLQAVQMTPYADRKPNQLSGGQQQRVALARALVIKPDVLLLDEPLSNLDAKLRLELRSEIRRLCKESGITGVYVTHDQKEALSMADRIAIMQSGKLVQVGTPHDVYTAPSNRFVAEFIGETNIIPGRVERRDAAGTIIATAAGMISATSNGPAPGTNVLLSVRPESIKLVTPDAPPRGGLAGLVIDSVYLGDSQQLLVELTDGVRVRATHLGSPAWLATGGAIRRPCRVLIAPEDVAILPVG